jgi:hypothetical protein
MQLPEPQRRDMENDMGHSESRDPSESGVAEQAGKSQNDPLSEALDYFRQQPVPVKKSRGIWPFRKNSPIPIYCN